MASLFHEGSARGRLSGLDDAPKTAKLSATSLGLGVGVGVGVGVGLGLG